MLEVIVRSFNDRGDVLSESIVQGYFWLHPDIQDAIRDIVLQSMVDHFIQKPNGIVRMVVDVAFPDWKQDPIPEFLKYENKESLEKTLADADRKTKM